MRSRGWDASMKVQKKVELEFAAIRGQYAKIRSIASHTKARHLWQQEAAVRERIKALQRMRTHAPHGYCQRR